MMASQTLPTESLHELGLIVEKRQVHVRRQFLTQLLSGLCFQRGGDFQHAAVGLAFDVEQNRLAALRRDARVSRRRPALHRRHVLDADRMAAVDRDHHVPDVRPANARARPPSSDTGDNFPRSCRRRRRGCFASARRSRPASRDAPPAISAGPRRRDIPARDRRGFPPWPRREFAGRAA